MKIDYLCGIMGVCLMFSVHAASGYELQGVIDEAIINDDNRLLVINNKQYKMDYETIVELPEDYNENVYGTAFSVGQLISFNVGITVDEGDVPRISEALIVNANASNRNNNKGSNRPVRGGDMLVIE